MEKERIKKILIDLIEEVQMNCKVEEDMHLFESGILDSMTILYIISEFEDQLQIELPVEEITEVNFKNINSIVDYISMKCR